jgi:magnesium transporter
VIRRTLQFPENGQPAIPVEGRSGDDTGWTWFDVEMDPSEDSELQSVVATLDLDPIAVSDAVRDYDLPKVDDFGHHLLVVLHGLCEDRIATYEVDAFLTANTLVTVHIAPAPALDALWSNLQSSAPLAQGGPDQLLARLADVLTRRLLTVLDVFDARVDDLVDMALDAHPMLLGELTAVRTDLSTLRRVVQPQREALDILRHGASPLVTAPGRRRFSDVFDVANRAVQGLDNARSMLAEILDAYRGAEARRATDVTKVLTIYAAIMLPLTLVTGFFGMNFVDLPGLGESSGWIVVTVSMATIALVSLGVFVAMGWIKRPSGRRAGRALGIGLIEAARAPVHLGSAVYEISTMPLRATVRHRNRSVGS